MVTLASAISMWLNALFNTSRLSRVSLVMLLTPSQMAEESALLRMMPASWLTAAGS